MAAKPTFVIAGPVWPDVQYLTACDVTGGRGELALDIPAELFGTLQLCVYRFDAQGRSRLMPDPIALPFPTTERSLVEERN